MRRPHKRRSRLLFDRRVQGRIILGIAWPPAVCLLATAAALAVFYSVALGRGVEVPGLTIAFAVAEGFLLVTLGCLIINALVVSNRIAGPAHRIGRTLRAVREGKLDSRTWLRKGDYQVELIAEVDGLLDWLQQRAGAESAGPEVAPTEVAAPSAAPIES